MPWKSEGKKAVSFFSFTHSGWSVERVIFHLPWSSAEGFYWFQKELDQTVFVMSGSWADVTSRELAVFPPSAQCVCVCVPERENLVQLFPKFCCLSRFLDSCCQTYFFKWLGGKIQAISFSVIVKAYWTWLVTPDVSPTTPSAHNFGWWLGE